VRINQSIIKEWGKCRNCEPWKYW